MSSSLRSLNLEINVNPTATPLPPSQQQQAHQGSGSSRILNDSSSSTLHLMVERVSSLKLQHQRQQQQQPRRPRRGSLSGFSPERQHPHPQQQPKEETSLEEQFMNKLALVQLMHKKELEELQRQLEHHASAVAALEEALAKKSERMEHMQMDLVQFQQERHALLKAEQERLLLQQRKTYESDGDEMEADEQNS